jgi:hypothetical protein
MFLFLCQLLISFVPDVIFVSLVQFCEYHLFLLKNHKLWLFGKCRNDLYGMTFVSWYQLLIILGCACLVLPLMFNSGLSL